MKQSKEEREALWIIAIAIVLDALSWHLIKSTYTYKTWGTYEGSGLLVGMAGVIIWIYGFLKYARAKGRSDLLAIVLSLTGLLGLTILLLLADVKKGRKSTS